MKEISYLEEYIPINLMFPSIFLLDIAFSSCCSGLSGPSCLSNATMETSNIVDTIIIIKSKISDVHITIKNWDQQFKKAYKN